MDKAIVQDYLKQAGMEQAQAEALSHILAEMATKADLERLKADLTWRMIAVVGLFGTIITLLNAFIG
jgi:hypothetical protein